jgi:membrane associated rhomboid family serine protease
MFQMLQNLPHITKNILIINVLMFIATFMFQGQINLTQELGVHTFNSPVFEPYQIVTHFFMHGGLAHIFFNMFALVMFGSQLERVWGPKRYFIFYIISAVGAYLLYGGFGTYDLYMTKQEILATFPDADITLMEINQQIISDAKQGMFRQYVNPLIDSYYRGALIPMVGASGAIFGLLAAFGMLFPNTQLMLLFPPIPIKAKYLVLGLMGIEVYLSFTSGMGSTIAHLAHVGGGVAGFIMVKIWKRDRSNFF